MVIDLILDRKDGAPFDAEEFAERVFSLLFSFPEVITPIINAIMTRCEQRVKHELCAYVLEGGYAPEICDFINSVAWLPDWWELD